MKNIKIPGFKTRFLFLFDNLDIEKFRENKYKDWKKKIDENIKKEKAKLRQEKRRAKLMQTARDLDREIQLYLLRVSPPRDEFEEMLLENMKKELGVITSVKELSSFLKISRSYLYEAIENGEILSIKKGKRKFVITEGLLPFLRN